MDVRELKVLAKEKIKKTSIWKSFESAIKCTLCALD